MAEENAYLGVSAYAGMHEFFNVRKFLRVFAHVNRPAISVVWGTFGGDHSLIREFCRKYQNRPHLVQIHFSNEVGRRNHKMYQGELLPELSVEQYNAALASYKPTVVTAIRRRLAAIRRAIARDGNANTEWIVSTGLEDNFTLEAHLAIIKILKEWWPEIKLVYNPMHVHRHPIELHTRSKSDADIINFDGFTIPENVSPQEAINTINASPWAKAVFLWSAPMQGINGPYHLTPPPRRRHFVVDSFTIKLFNQILLEVQNGQGNRRSTVFPR